MNNSDRNRNSRNSRNRNRAQDQNATRIIAALMVLAAGVIAGAFAYTALENEAPSSLPESETPGSPELPPRESPPKEKQIAPTAPEPSAKEESPAPKAEMLQDAAVTDNLTASGNPPENDSPAAPEPPAVPEKTAVTEVCNSRDSCYKSGHDLYISGNTRNALPFLKAGCDLNHRESCYLAGLSSDHGNISYEEAAAFLTKGCTMNHGDSCLSLEELIAKRFPDNAEMKHNARKLRNAACNRGAAKACGRDRPASGTTADTRRDGIKETRIVRHSSDRPTDYYGCGDLDFESCFEILAEAKAAKKPLPFGMHEWRILEDSCRKFNIGRGCKLYAEKFREDDTGNINYKSLMGRKQYYLDKACHLLRDTASCNAAKSFRTRHGYGNNAYSWKSATEGECYADIKNCLKRANAYEHNESLAPEIRSWKAAQLYEEACLRGEPEGCQELRRLNPPWW